MSGDSTNLRQEFTTELESILESDEAYGSNIQILTYSLKEDVINGKFKDSWNNRVYEFIIDVDGISYKPAVKLDSFSADDLPARFDAFSGGYTSLLDSTRLDKGVANKRTKKPKCGAASYGCGFTCMGLEKICRILSSGKKAGTSQGKAIGKERLIKLVELARRLNNEGDKTKALAIYGIAKNIKSERDRYKSQGNERKAERIVQRETGQPTNKSKLNGTHDLIPLLDKDKIDRFNFKHPEVIDKISTITGMTKSEARASAKAVNAYSEDDYEKIRKAEYAGIETPQTKAINRYLDKMPKFEGEIFRGRQYKAQQDLDDLIEKLKKGHDYELPAMSSFSSDIETATTFAAEGAVGLSRWDESIPVIFKVTGNKSGVTIKNISANEEEDEVLVKKGTKYKINGTIETIDHKGKKVTIVPLKEY